MCARCLSPFLLLLAAAPLQGQTCYPEPASDIASLLPDRVAGLGRQFYTRQGECTTNLYRPVVMSADEGGAWAVVSIEPGPGPSPGATATALADHWADHWAERAAETWSLDGWPLARSTTDLGIEFVALRGAYEVTVLVKDAASPDEEQALAGAILREIFIRIPCSTGR